MVDEEVAAHQLVDEKFFDQGSSAVLREHASRWGSFEGVGHERLDGLVLLSFNLFGDERTSDLFWLMDL